MATATYKSFSYILALVLNACLGSVFFGYMTTEMTYLKDALRADYEWDSHKSENVMLPAFLAMLPVGAIIGVLCCGDKILGKLGRMKSLILSDLVGSIGCIICVFIGGDGATQIVGRLVIGFSVGVNSQIVPIYNNEMTPKEVSGTFGSLFQLTNTVGSFLAIALSLAMPELDSDNHYDKNDKTWMLVFLFPIAICIVRTLLFLTVFRFDTPFSLLKKGCSLEEVKENLRNVYKEEYIDEVLANIQKKTSDFKNIRYSTLFKVYSNRLILGILLTISQQLSGINAVLSDAGSFYGSLATGKVLKVLTMMNPIVLFLAALFCSKTSDMQGRRILLLAGTSLCGALLVIMGVLNLPSISNTNTNYVFFAFSMVYMLGFGCSLGPVVWMYEPEILPEAGVGLCTISNWIFTCLVMTLTPMFREYMGNYVFFFFYGICCFVSVGYMMPLLKETKGLKAEEINQIFGTLPNEEDHSSNGEKVFPTSHDSDSPKARLLP